MQLLYALESIRTPLLDTLMAWITECGGELVFMAVAITMFWCVSKACGYYMLTVGFTGTILNQFLKLAFRIPRPWVKDPDFTIVESARAGATGYSFPSGHTQNVFASFGCGMRWTKRTGLRIVCAVIVVLTAFSRMYLGVHTPLDVGVSFGIGLVLVFALYPLFSRIEERPNTMYWLFGVMIVLNLAYLLYAELWPFPADVDAANLAEGRKNAYTLLGAVLGMTGAYFIDRKYVHFDVRAVWWAQVLKVVLGLALTVALRTVLKAPLLALFGGHNAAHLLRYFIMVLFAGGVWPMTFRWFGRLGKKT
ncbi:MAG: phosphatase PAP2 family protein [Oscillospiraceae bacterium]|nr:phosphatase PAP2 family protein [Oscillospiraceae bacterium]